MMSRRTLATVVIVASLAALPLLAAPVPEKTLANLQAAFNGESNANARYLAFAKKADAEGYGNAASLFRAASKAEEIHAANHAAIIKKLGAVPKADVKAPDVKSTKENLDAAIKGESYERDTMYPDFIKQAKLDKEKDAVEAFNEAKGAEAGHAQLYTEALNNLDKWKGGKKDFWVCGICGYTVPKIDFKKCPNCFQPIDKYVKVD
jgi:rubrerythrin